VSEVAVAILRLPHGQGLPLPERATPGAAGVDLLAAVEGDVRLAPGERALVPTGIAIALPAGYEAQVRPRSGLALAHGVTVLNAPGTIDADYRGEIQVIAINLGGEPIVIEPGQRVAQIVVQRVVRAQWQEVTELPASERQAGGFGHTDKK
jgi:dUTP pyrophosphatase